METNKQNKKTGPKTKNKLPKCPNGTRRNKKTGNCEPILKALPEVTAQELQAESVKQPEPNIFIEPPIVPMAGPPETVVDDKLKKSMDQPVGNLAVVKDPSKIILTDTLATVSKRSNEYLRQTEKIEHDTRGKIPNSYEYLYPDLNDPQFAAKIAQRKEFNDFQYDGSIKSIEETANKLCKAAFELMPHQVFVKNFLSFQTPYNSLLLYCGLGTGKTCSAIGVAEEMRSYMKQVGIKQRIMVIASPNVQNNFRLQLFDERGLREENGAWNIQSCIGNSLIKEINPTNLKGLSRERVVNQIRTIINQSYVFMGYTQLANYISEKTGIQKDSGFTPEEQAKMEIRNIRRIFNNRLIIIDEVHNIRLSEENKDWKTAQGLMKLAKHCENLRLLLLSATPMYNSYKEIIWLVNLMNLNDKRGTIKENEVFDKDGNFLAPSLNADGKVIKEGGRELLLRKMIGYVSYVRGENPYTFPYRIYPNEFSPENAFIPAGNGSLITQVSNIIARPANARKYPTIQLNSKTIVEPLKHIPVYLTEIGSYQQKAYRLIIESMRAEIDRQESAALSFEDMDKFGFRKLQIPIEALNMVYPSDGLDRGITDGSAFPTTAQRNPTAQGIPTAQGNPLADDAVDEDNSEYLGDSNPLSTVVGKAGLRNIMTHVDDSKKIEPSRHSFAYKPGIIEKYGRIFSKDVLPNYSAKIAKICEIIRQSTGIVLIYSQYIDGGAVPMALALEEMGFTRYGSASYTKPLFLTPPVEPVDSLTMKPKSELPEGRAFRQAKYIMITGDKAFSPQNAADIKQATSLDNKNGELVKVILISKAGSEGLDFKNIRQIHILEPWYNMNRIEQIIGRGVRNLSHCGLPFVERNVEIYMHGTLLGDEEAADLYVYRLAEKKALQMGKVTRALKEVAVDCLLNIGQTNFTVEKLSALAENKNVMLTLSTGKKQLNYKIGDRPFTDICDYMDSCDFKCSSSSPGAVVVKDTYGLNFLQGNNPRIMERIRQIFKDQYFYRDIQLISAINITKQYPIEQIYSALSAFVNNKNEILIDRYGRRGTLINKGDVYAFQPVEINDESISIYHRSTPIDLKHSTLNMEIAKEFKPEEAAPVLAEKTPREVPVSSDYDNSAEYDKIIAEIDANIKNAFSKATDAKKKTIADSDWYKHANTVIDHLQTKYGIGFNDVSRYIVRHCVDMLLPKEKLVLIKKLYGKIHDSVDAERIESRVKSYLDEKMVTVGKRVGFFLAEDNKWTIYLPVPNETTGETDWFEASSEDIRQFELGGALGKFRENPAECAKLFGFINLFQSRNEMVFKIKDIVENQNYPSKGTRIDSQIKQNNVRRLNTIIESIPGGIPYEKEEAKFISSTGFCVLLEIVMRNMTDKKMGGKIWFMDPERSMYNRIVDYRRGGSGEPTVPPDAPSL
jgi:hypothetical protein